MKTEQRLIKVVYMVTLRCSKWGAPNWLIVYKVRGCACLRHAYTAPNLNDSYAIGDWSINKWYYMSYYYDKKQGKTLITRINRKKAK